MRPAGWRSRYGGGRPRCSTPSRRRRYRREPDHAQLQQGVQPAGPRRPDCRRRHRVLVRRTAERHRRGDGRGERARGTGVGGCGPTAVRGRAQRLRERARPHDRRQGGRDRVRVPVAVPRRRHLAAGHGVRPERHVRRYPADAQRQFRVTLPDPQETNPRTLTTPWRTLIVGDIATVTESDLVTDLAMPSKVADTSWIKPGRAAWSWWSDGSSAGSLAAQEKYTDFAARMGWDRVLVDAGWSASWVPTLVKYAQARHIGVWIWTRQPDTTPRRRSAPPSTLQPRRVDGLHAGHVHRQAHQHRRRRVGLVGRLRVRPAELRRHRGELRRTPGGGAVPAAGAERVGRDEAALWRPGQHRGAGAPARYRLVRRGDHRRPRAYDLDPARLPRRRHLARGRLQRRPRRPD